MHVMHKGIHVHHTDSSNGNCSEFTGLFTFMMHRTSFSLVHKDTGV